MEKELSLMQHDIEHEKKIIELFGYNLIGPNGSNRWLIVDENNNEVGFIQYKKLFRKNIKKGYPATFGYCTKIDSEVFSYKSTRKINNLKNKTTSDTKFSYAFDIKRKSGNLDHVEISMSNSPYLNVWSKKYGFIDFKIDSKGLYLDFKSQTENFNVEELTIFNSTKESEITGQKNYTYQIRYCNKDKKLSDEDLKGSTIREISGSSSLYQRGYNQISLSDKTWVNGKLRTDRKNEVTGTVEELATKHQMGIDSIRYFRTLIDQILPFKEDIVLMMLNDNVIEEYNLDVMMPDLKRESKDSKQVKCKKK